MLNYDKHLSSGSLICGPVGRSPTRFTARCFLPPHSWHIFLLKNLIFSDVVSNFLANIKHQWNEYVPSSSPLLSCLMARRGSATSSTPIPPPIPLQRSSRMGWGAGGHDVQLDQLADILIAPTCQRKHPFMPDDLGSLPVNPRAPAPKKKWTRRKKVHRYTTEFLPRLTGTNQMPVTPPLEDPAQLQPQSQPQPQSQLQSHLPSQPPIDPWFGFFPPPSQSPPRSQPPIGSPNPSPVLSRRVVYSILHRILYFLPVGERGVAGGGQEERNG